MPRLRCPLRPEGRRRYALGLLASLVAGSLPAACGGGPNGWLPREARSGETAIYEAATRYIVQHYVPDPGEEDPFGVVCLATGRRHQVPLGQQERGEEWDPEGGLLGRLEGLPRPVAPVSECRWNERLEEVHRPTGRRAVVVAISHPRWESELTAWVDVESRENHSWSFRYRCHLAWRTDQWTVRSCV